jgi:hypothetical protein
LIYKGFRAFSYFSQSDYYAALFAVIHRWWLHWWLHLVATKDKKNKAPEGAF